MAWSIVGVSAVVETTTGTLTLTEPAGVVQGDLLVACIAARGYATTATFVTRPANWLAVNSVGNANTLTTTSALASGAMAYIVRGASAPSYVFTLGGTASVAIGRVVAYRGNAATTSVDTNTLVTTATNTTAVNVAGLTTTVPDDLIVAMIAGGQEAAWSAFNATTPAGASGATDTTTAPTTTWIERADTSTVTGADTSLGIFDAVKTTAGATGNLTATASLGAGHVVIAGAFRLLPAPTDTWNVNDKSADITLSNGDRTATHTAAVTSGVRSLTTRVSGTAGKYYAEFLLGSTIFNNFGITPTSNSLTATTLNFYVDTSLNIHVNNVTIGFVPGSTVVAGDVFCIAWDTGAKKAWFRLNGGAWNTSGDPAAGTGGSNVSFAASTAHALWAQIGNLGSGESVTIRAKLADFTRTVPAGFSSWIGEAPATGDVSANVTGQAGTASAGTVTVTTVASVSTEVTGEDATASAGTVTVSTPVNVSTTVTGQEATAAAGTVTANAVRNVSTTATGQAAAASAGTATVTAVQNVSATVTGQSAAASAGTVTVRIGASTTVTGQAAAASAGTVTVSQGTGVSTSITGQAAAASTGTVTATAVRNISTTVTGQAAAAAAGTVSASVGTGISVNATGQAATASAGTVTVTANRTVSTTVTGQAATAAAGTVTVGQGTGVSTSMTGQSATAAAGTVTVTANRAASVSVTGQSAAATAGNISVTAGGAVSAGVTGQAATAAAGTATATAVRNISTSVTGQVATTAAGSVTVTAKQQTSASVLGQAAAASVGTVTVSAVSAATGFSVWNGTAWVDKPAKVWTGAAWMAKPVKRWNGSTWV